MRLDELQLSTAKALVKANWPRLVEVERWLASKGFKKLGSGVYGSVWTDDHRAVVKVFAHDPCYAKFAEFCRQNRGNQHLPRISKLYPMPDHGGVVFMEPLTPMKTDNLAHDMNFYFNTKVHVRRGATKMSARGPAARFAEKHPSLAGTLDKLVDIFGSACGVDIHVGNVMLRGSTVVITDPFMSSDHMARALEEPRHVVQEVAEPGVTGFWYHPATGASVEVPPKTDHYGVVLNRPESFGIPEEQIAAANFDMREIEKLAKERGWARVSGPGRYGSPMIDVLDVDTAWHTAHWMIKNGLIADKVTIEWGDGWWLDLLDDRTLRRFLASKTMAREFAKQRSERNDPYD